MPPPPLVGRAGPSSGAEQAGDLARLSQLPSRSRCAGMISRPTFCVVFSALGADARHGGWQDHAEARGSQQRWRTRGTPQQSRGGWLLVRMADSRFIAFPSDRDFLYRFMPGFFGEHHAPRPDQVGRVAVSCGAPTGSLCVLDPDGCRTWGVSARDPLLRPVARALPAGRIPGN